MMDVSIVSRETAEEEWATATTTGAVRVGGKSASVTGDPERFEKSREEVPLSPRVECVERDEITSSTKSDSL
jgi:hypothetical protein